jgi:hypothetical protein
MPRRSRKAGQSSAAACPESYPKLNLSCVAKTLKTTVLTLFWRELLHQLAYRVCRGFSVSFPENCPVPTANLTPSHSMQVQGMLHSVPLHWDMSHASALLLLSMLWLHSNRQNWQNYYEPKTYLGKVSQAWRPPFRVLFAEDGAFSSQCRNFDSSEQNSGRRSAQPRPNVKRNSPSPCCRCVGRLADAVTAHTLSPRLRPAMSACGSTRNVR